MILASGNNSGAKKDDEDEVDVDPRSRRKTYNDSVDPQRIKNKNEKLEE